MKRRFGIALLTAALAALTSPAIAITAAATDDAQSLDAIARRALASGFTPGMSVAVVRGDRMIWSAGYGASDLESGRGVTADTRFYIGSTSKALTALAAAQLAARGQLDLDASLAKVLPGAVCPAGVSCDSIRVRDLLTHTHGIDPQGPVSVRVAYTGEYENADLLAALGAHAAAKTGRAFQYSNLGYDLLGVILAPAETRGWKRVVEHEVTGPLGMRMTTSFRSKIADNVIAMPHELRPAGFERVPLAKQDANMGPAGGHFSTAPDLARLLIAELSRGRIGGRAVIAPEVIAETQRLQAVQDRDFGPYHRHGWGLGWDLGTFGADTLLHRFGTFAGYRSHVSFMPRRGLGVVVLVNGGGASSPLADVVANSIYDHLLGVADAGARFEARLAELTARGEKSKAAMAVALAERAARPQQLPHALGAYAGVYTNPAFGTLELRELNGRLEAVMGVARCPVEAYDAAKNLLRVELLGGGDVVEARFVDGAPLARELRMLGSSFERRP